MIYNRHIDPMNIQAQYYIGIDAHKRFSQVHVLDQDGATLWKSRADETFWRWEGFDG